MFKSSTQPLCRYSGKPIPKYTTTTYFGNGPTGTTIREYPRNQAEAQRYVNGKVVAVRYWRKEEGYRPQGTPDHDFVHYATVWDGESYVDEFFASQTHAVRFAYLMARSGYSTKAYNNAVKENDCAA
jgi:hypothetical protein